MKRIILIAAGAVVLTTLIVLNMRSDRSGKTDVSVTKVARRSVAKVITASGNIQPRRRVNVSASAIGKVTRVAVAEGDHVDRGDFLLQIDPTPYQTAVDRLRAAVLGAEAVLSVEEATRTKAQYDYERSLELSKKEFVSDNDLREARVAVEIAEARVRSANQALIQTRAQLAKSEHDLDEVRITAGMSGIITALNVEVGESAIMGTMNNPGTVLLTIADLSEMEAEVRVDETEVVFIEPGQDVAVTLDAFPDTSFAGVVREVGNSAIRGQLGLGQESVDFKVVITILDSIPNIRPGLSASVDVTVAEAEDVLAIPIQCLTVRDRKTLERREARGEDAGDTTGESGIEVYGDDEDDDQDRDVEGVFVVADGIAGFRRVDVGIAGEKHFEVKTGLEEGESVVSGPFSAIGELRDGDRVKLKKKRSKKR
ncbi:MAG: efflux RND transporter periplasmic adaptor subunit [Candidatus Krumholzibacteria bacterium]|nr:efflux RND transporter periplasmic adaptor subunit [Candidatus Krumholzibacteria bacterium]